MDCTWWICALDGTSPYGKQVQLSQIGESTIFIGSGTAKIGPLARLVAGGVDSVTRTLMVQFHLASPQDHYYQGMTQASPGFGDKYYFHGLLI